MSSRVTYSFMAQKLSSAISTVAPTFDTPTATKNSAAMYHHALMRLPSSDQSRAGALTFSAAHAAVETTRSANT